MFRFKKAVMRNLYFRVQIRSKKLTAHVLFPDSHLWWTVPKFRRFITRNVLLESYLNIFQRLFNWWLWSPGSTHTLHLLRMPDSSPIINHIKMYQTHKVIFMRIAPKMAFVLRALNSPGSFLRSTTKLSYLSVKV